MLLPVLGQTAAALCCSQRRMAFALEFRKLRVSLALALCTAVAAHSHYECQHDSSPEKELVVAAQRYAPRHGRRALDATLFSPIRIQVEQIALDNVTDAQRAFLVDELLPAAVREIARALAVEMSVLILGAIR